MRARTLGQCLLLALVAGCGGGDEGASGARAPLEGASTRGAMTAEAAGKEVAVGADPLATSATTATLDAASLAAPMYALDFVATAASGYGLNDGGDVVGKGYTDPGCGPFCLPPQEIAVWRAGQRIALPDLPGYTDSMEYPLFINNQGLVVGEVGIPGSGTRAAAWIPNGSAYAAQDIGVFPGTSSAEVYGLDQQGRMVGWATLGGAIPTLTVPFVWTQAAGLADLRAFGFPNERPVAISPGGKVVTWGSWYQLGDAASVRPLPPPPTGFVGTGVNGSAINDAGDQAHFLATTSADNLRYPFRLTSTGAWQQIGTGGTGQLSRYGMGSISPARDVTFTALGSGQIATGPLGLGQPLTARLSPAYPKSTVTEAGPMNASGQILAQVLVGNSRRLVKLTPAPACGSDCAVASALTLSAQFVQDPAHAGSCYEGGKMYNLASATVTITDENGTALANATVRGRFLDDYWADKPVSGTTGAAGAVSFSQKGPCGVGAIAFLVDGVTLGARRFDRTRGVLSASAIPGATTSPPPPSGNQAPVAVPQVSCSAGRVCTLDGRASYDPDGSIAKWRWATTNGTTLSTQSLFTTTFPKAGKTSAVLYVTDNGGLTASKKVSFTVLR